MADIADIIDENFNENIDEKKDIINEKEFDKAMAAAEKAAGKNLYCLTIHFKQPREWEGQTYESLTFEWDKLTGEDFLTIEHDMNLRNRAVVSAEFSGEFLLQTAVKACREKPDDRFLCKLPIAVFNRIRNGARDFLNAAQA